MGRAINSVGVVGGGLMGAGIAEVSAVAGLPVVGIEPTMACPPACGSALHQFNVLRGFHVHRTPVAL